MGLTMFLFRSMFWLTAVVLLLPPADGDQPAPRISLLETAQAARALIQDVSELCERNRNACATSRDAIMLLRRKAETGAVFRGVLAGMGRDRAAGADASPEDLHGTLTAADLVSEWAGPAGI